MIKTALKRYTKSDLIYDANHSFCKYQDIKIFDNLSLKSKCSFLVNLSNNLGKFSRLKRQKEKQKKKRKIV